MFWSPWRRFKPDEGRKFASASHHDRALRAVKRTILRSRVTGGWSAGGQSGESPIVFQKKDIMALCAPLRKQLSRSWPRRCPGTARTYSRLRFGGRIEVAASFPDHSEPFHDASGISRFAHREKLPENHQQVRREIDFSKLHGVADVGDDHSAHCVPSLRQFQPISCKERRMLHRWSRTDDHFMRTETGNSGATGKGDQVDSHATPRTNKLTFSALGRSLPATSGTVTFFWFKLCAPPHMIAPRPCVNRRD